MGCLNFLAIVLAISIVTVFCEIENKEEAIKRGNNFVDKVTIDVKEKHGEEFDPCPLENKIIGFFKKGIFFNVSGEASLHDGSITGLSTLSRAGDCLLNEKGDKLYVQAHLRASDLKMKYSGTAKVMKIGPTITVHGEVDYIEVDMKMHCNADDGKDGKLDKFAVVEIRGMKVWIDGLGPLDWALNSMIKAITTIFRSFLHRIVEKQLHVYFAVKIHDYQFPVEGVDVDEITIAKQTNEPVAETEAPVLEPSGDRK